MKFLQTPSSFFLLLSICASDVVHGFLQPGSRSVLSSSLGRPVSTSASTSKSSTSTVLHNGLMWQDQCGEMGSHELRYGILGGYVHTPEYDEYGNEIPVQSDGQVKQLMPDQMQMGNGSPAEMMARAMKGGGAMSTGGRTPQQRDRPKLSPRQQTYYEDPSGSTMNYQDTNTRRRSSSSSTDPRTMQRSVARTQTPRIPFENVQQLTPPAPVQHEYDYYEEEEEEPVYEEQTFQEEEPEYYDEPEPEPPVPPPAPRRLSAVGGTALPKPLAPTPAVPKRKPAAAATATSAPTVPSPQKISQGQVRSLFYLWNDALATGDARIVAKRYWDDAMLIGTISDQVRTSLPEIQDYFTNFLKLEPQGIILDGDIKVGYNWAKDSGVYEFTMGAEGDKKVRARYSFLYTYDKGQWKIAHHHSSFMPEAIGRGQPVTEDQVRNLFHLWNDALATLDAAAVTKRYAKNAVLLPTISDEPRVDHKGIQNYFETFLKLKPQVTILDSYVTVGDNWCKDVGVYEYTMLDDPKSSTTKQVKARYSFVYVWEDGAWKISHQHSSVMPEAALGGASSSSIPPATDDDGKDGDGKDGDE